MALGWENILQSSDYLNTLRRFQNAGARQFRAVPAASPEVRGVAADVGGRLTKLRDIGSEVDLAEKRKGFIDLKRQEMDLERRELDRYAGRLPWATAIGLGNLGLQGLGVFANISAVRRSEARGQQLSGLQAGRSAAEADRLRALMELEQQRGSLYQGFLSKFPEPTFP